MKRIVFFIIIVVMGLSITDKMVIEASNDMDSDRILIGTVKKDAAKDNHEKMSVSKSTIPSKSDLEKVLRNNTSEKIVKIVYDDFDKNGIYEAYIFTGEKYEADEFGPAMMIGKMWFVTRKGAILIDEHFGGYYKTRTLNVKNESLFIADTYYATSTSSSVWEVDNYSCKCSIDGGYVYQEKNNIYVTDSQYDSANVHGIQTGHTWKKYWLYYDNGLKEYGALEISKKQFLQFKGANGILQSINKEGGENIQILYRANRIININYSIAEGADESYVNLTLTYNNNSVKKINKDAGTYKKAFNNKIAKFPKTLNKAN